jgi:zinc transport system ATP-binding protein
MKKLIELRSLDTGYEESTVLRDVNLSIFDRDFIGVIGPNGGGKTTLLKVILGLIKPFKGEVIYGEGLVKQDQRTSIGYLPQFNETDKKFPITVREVVLSGLLPANNIFYRYSKSDLGRVNDILQTMGMGNKSDSHIGELSGGQLQRVFLARAIVSEPSLLILDEPATYVDSRFETELYELLPELNKKMAILLISHDVGIISGYIKSIACVNGNLHYHNSNVISSEQLKVYNCPIDIITHGKVPHRVLAEHKHK